MSVTISATELIERLAGVSGQWSFGVMAVDMTGELLIFTPRVGENLGMVQPAGEAGLGFDEVFGPYFDPANDDFFSKVQNTSSAPGQVRPEVTTFTTRDGRRSIAMASDTVAGGPGEQEQHGVIVFLRSVGSDETPQKVAHSLASRLTAAMAHPADESPGPPAATGLAYRFTAIALASVIVLWTGFYFYSEKSQQAQAPAQEAGSALAADRTALVTRKPLSTLPPLNATASAVRVARVNAPFDGVVKTVNAQYGAKVRQGQALFTMDTKGLESQLESATASDNEADRAAAENVKTLIARAQVTAPVDGYVVSPAKGQGLAEGADVTGGLAVVGVAALDELRFYALAPEADADKISVGMKALANPSIFDGEDLDAHVTGVSDEASEKDGVSYVTVTVRPVNIKPSIAAAFVERAAPTATVYIYDRPDSLTIPESALRGEKGARSVTVVDKTGSRHEVAVKTGAAIGGDVEIISGVKEGQRVLID